MGLAACLLKAAFLLAAAFLPVFPLPVIDQCEIQVQIVGHGSVALCAALVGRDDYAILPIFDIPFDPFAKERLNLK